METDELCTHPDGGDEPGEVQANSVNSKSKLNSDRVVEVLEEGTEKDGEVSKKVTDITLNGLNEEEAKDSLKNGNEELVEINDSPEHSKSNHVNEISENVTDVLKKKVASKKEDDQTKTDDPKGKRKFQQNEDDEAKGENSKKKQTAKEKKKVERNLKDVESDEDDEQSKRG